MQRWIDGGNNQKIEQVADQILSLDANDVDAIQCKLIALIKQSAFDRAIALIKKDGGAQLGDRTFEMAYCHFRSGNLDASLAALDSTEETSARVQELRAQVLYRKEKFQESTTM